MNELVRGHAFKHGSCAHAMASRLSVPLIVLALASTAGACSGGDRASDTTVPPPTAPPTAAPPTTSVPLTTTTVAPATTVPATTVPAGEHAVRPDPYVVAQAWFELVRPRLEDLRTRSKRPYVLLRDLDVGLGQEPLPLDDVEAALSRIPTLPSLEERIHACIIGIPD